MVLQVVRFYHRRRLWLSSLALAFAFIVGSTYILIGGLRISPFTPTYRVTVQLAESGGLLPQQDVMFQGAPVGRVESVNVTQDSVNAIVSINSPAKIPTSSTVRVSGLSPAGEQYIGFSSRSDTGPFLTDGAVIELGKATTPVTLAQLLADADGALAQIDPHKLDIIRKELSLSKDGPRKLTEIIDGGTFLLSTLDSVLPETVSLLRSSRIVFTAAADVNNGIAVTSRNLNKVLNGVNRMEGGYRTLVDTGQQRFNQIDSLFSDNSDTMVQLLGNLTTVSHLTYMRVPALNALFPDYRGSMLEALTTILHDGGGWATADIYPRYTCDYGTPRMPPSSAEYPEPFLNTFCRDDDPAVLIRGAKNAPRPAGDDTAGPRQGADLGATTDPTLKGHFSIPTSSGGPTLPMEPPS
ncbi:mammalian cell entry protein [Mycobacteroides franklinii]|uniref:Mammalian cell entry protein n=2 Tax=Mycobacteroides franklinii TaxID=948102 RepID=A0A1S1LA40_9MYCO|nr:MlaD family protein [Mycobacteroides franklinii]OHU22706.1 mammalian cell entry protein [Mycobacteroides franklinii]